MAGKLRLVFAAAAGAVIAALPGAPAAGAPAPDVEISATQALPGQVRFFLTGRNLPSGAALGPSTVTVSVDGEKLPTVVETISASKGAAPVPTVAQRGSILVFDVSGSMEGQPLAAAKEAAAAYAAGLPADVALGLVTFADRPSSVLSPTADRAPFGAAVSGLAAKGETSLYDGIREGIRLLAAHPEYQERRVVVLSDGEDTKSAARPAEIAAALAAERVSLDVVAFGSAAAGADVSGLATGTGGRLVPAGDAAALRAAFEELAGGVSKPVMVTAKVPVELGGRSAMLRVAVSAGGRDIAAAQTTVVFRPDTRASVPLAEVSRQLLPTITLYVALAAISLSVLLLAFVVMSSIMGRSKLKRRLRQLDSYSAQGRGAGAHADEGNAFVRAALAMSDKAVEKQGRKSKIEDALDEAAIALRPNEWILLRVAVTVATIAGFLLLVPAVFAVILGAPLGWLGPEGYRRVRANRRAKRFADTLPESLQLIVSALRSGFSLPQSIDALVREGAEPVASEFGRALAEIRLGGDLEDALERTAVRNKSRDLEWLVMAIRIQREVGGNLSEVMETAVETMRERARVARHVRALSAEGRLSAYVLVGLPIALSAFMFMFRGEYLRPLYTTFLGLCMLAAGVIMLALGCFWLSKLIKVKV